MIVWNADRQHYILVTEPNVHGAQWKEACSINSSVTSKKIATF